MSLKISIPLNTLEPGLAKAARALGDPRPVLEAMAVQLISLTKRAFTTAALRAATWPPKKDGSPATLRQEGRLWQSIAIAQLTRSQVTVGSDAPYAAAHQLGSSKRHLPPRPYFPFLPSGQLLPAASAKIADAAQRALEREVGSKK